MQQLLLLHGALGSKHQLQPLATALSNTFKIHTLNFSGHGGRQFPENSFSIPLFSTDIETYLQEHAIEQINIFGYSMGGYAAMYLAKHHPAKVKKIVTLATKFHWDVATAAKEVKMLNGKTIQEKVPAFAAQLQERHAPTDWLQLLDKTTDLLTGLGRQNALPVDAYTGIATPSLLLLGDRDKMVTLEETLAVYKQLPNAQMGIIPGTPHALEQANLPILTALIMQYLQ